MRSAFRAITALLFPLVTLFVPAEAQNSPPRPAPFLEQAEVHRVQVDVSVVDPDRRSQASVPGLPPDAFEIRLDGRPLPPEVQSRVDFDPICRPSPDTAAALRPGNAPVLVLVDLNFLDIRSRHKVAQSLKDLAGLMAEKPLRVKVLVFSNHVYPLTPDFTEDPEELRRAAALLTESVAKGPPLRNLNTRKVPEGPESVTEPRSFIDLAWGELPDDPAALVPAYDLQFPQLSEDIKEVLQTKEKIPATRELARREVDPRPSLAALESVLLSHGALRGRKALVLFSSSWFDLPEELWLQYVMSIQEAAQGGFSIWAVDASAWSASVGAGHESNLLDFLANSTGGEVVRSTGRLGIVFERADEVLSCYYLFSIPLPSPASGQKRYTVDVRLNTRKYPKLWNYRVRLASNLTLRDPLAERQRRRLAALMEPAAYRFPEIRLSAAYPSGDRMLQVPLDIFALLADLSFFRDPGGNGYLAKLAWEGLATDGRGQIVCRLGDGLERQVRAESPPARFPPTFLNLRTTCTIPGPGTYEFRLVVQDLNSGEIGAARATLEVRPPSEKLASISAVRLSKSSGRDFFLETGAPGTAEIPRDFSRQVFSPLSAGETVYSADRLSVRFVACGLSALPRVMLLQTPGNGVKNEAPGTRVPLAWIPILERGSQVGLLRTCREYEAQIPEGTLRLGRYALGLDLGEALGTEVPSSPLRALFGEIPFQVVPPPQLPAGPERPRG